MLPVLMLVGGLLALWVQSQPAISEQNLPNGILRTVGGMLVIAGVVAFFSQSIALLLVVVGIILGFLTSQRQ